MYFGERGQFRGFIAAQEGWLTEGESGITGQSIATIFEFPKEERRRVKRVKRLKVPESAERIAPSPYGPLNTYTTSVALAQLSLRRDYWDNPNREAPARAAAGFAEYWKGKAAAADLAYCRSQGYNRAVGVAPPPPPGVLPQDLAQGFTNNQLDEGWGYAEFTSNSGSHAGRAYQYVRWSATCQKKVRRTRR